MPYRLKISQKYELYRCANAPVKSILFEMLSQYALRLVGNKQVMKLFPPGILCTFPCSFFVQVVTDGTV